MIQKPEDQGSWIGWEWAWSSNVLILIGSGQSLHFDEVKEAAQLQFPDHRPTPMVTFMREFDNRGDRQQQAPQQSSPSKGFNFKKGKGKGKDKGKPSQNKTYVTEATAEETADVPEEEGDGNDIIDNEEQINDEEYVEENQDFDGQAEEEENDDSLDALREAAECLTVTARRLQGLTLGRKFSGQQSIQERKKNTHCAICGERGHWQGDEECQYSNSGGKNHQKGSSGGSSNNRAKTGKAGSKGKSDNDKTKKVFTVMHHDGQSRTVTFQDETSPEETYGTYFTYMVKSPCEIGNISKIYGTSMNELCHFVVLDTACQKSCCSSQWMEHYQNILTNHRMKVKFVKKREPFEFGHGPTQFSDHHAYMPVCFDGSSSTTCLLGAYVIPNTNDIPFLGSHSLMQKLQMVLDLPNNKVRIGSLRCEVEMHMVNGHLALKIDHTPRGSCHESVWKTLSMLSDQPEADAELIAPPKPSPLEHEAEISADQLTDAEPVSTPAMVGQLEAPGEAVLSCRDVPGDDNAAGDQAPSSSSILASTSRSHGHGAADGPDGKGRRTMSSREDPKVRKQVRPLCKVSGLPDDLAVGRGKAKMGLKGIAKAAISTLAILFNSGGLFGEESSPRLGHESSERTNVPTWGEFDIKPIGTIHQEAGEVASSQTQENSRQTQHAGGGRGRLRLGLGGGLGEKKAANYAWLASHLRAQQRLYNYEVEAYKTLATYERIRKDGGKIDLMEVFSGRGRLTSSAHRYGLNALQPIDTNEGFDLTTYEGKCITMHALSQFKPLLLVVAWPCTVWSSMNENSNYSNRPEELAALRQQERPLVNFSADLCSTQIEEQRLYLGENPLKSRLWSEKKVEKLFWHPDTLVTTCHAGAYGAEDADGFPIIKTHRWLTNSTYIAKELQLKMTPEQQMYARPIEGSRTKASGEYCQGLANAILRGLLKEARKRNPTRFRETARVF